MAVPQFSDPGMEPPKISGTPRNYQESIEAMDRLAGQIEQSHQHILDWLRSIRLEIESRVVSEEPTAETSQFVMEVVKWLLLQAELYHREIFDAFAANQFIRPVEAQLTDAERKSIRKSALRVESIQKDIVAQLRQNADALFAYYDHYMTTGSPPDPWPPE